MVKYYTLFFILCILGAASLPGQESPGELFAGPPGCQPENFRQHIQDGGDEVSVAIGSGTDIPLVRMPFDFYWKNSLRQTIYYSSEIDLDSGMLTGLSYHNNFASDVMDREIRIWVGETGRESLQDGWVDPASLTLVFDGSVDFPGGQNTIKIDLQQPFFYSGGNLVVYTHRVWENATFSVQERFYATQDAGSGRTRWASADATVYNPADPVTGVVNDWYPNTVLHFSMVVPGSIEGAVTGEGSLLDGVRVILPETSDTTYTDSSGAFGFYQLAEGSYCLEFSKFGFEPLLVEDVLVENGETTVVDASMVPIPKYEVSGLISGNDGFVVEGAVISLDGYENYSASSGENGLFAIPGVFEGEYLLTVTAEGFVSHVQENVLIDSDGTLPEIILTEIIYAPHDLVVDWDGLDAGEILFTWSHGADEKQALDLVAADKKANKAFEGFTIFLDDLDNPVAEGVSSSQYLFSGLASGDYTVGVQAVYSSGTSGIVTLDFSYDHGVVVEYFDVTFRVHFHAFDGFDPETDIVYLTGDLTGWSAPGDDHNQQVMEASDDDPLVYLIHHTLPAGTYEYKYFLNAGWDGGEWDGGLNREILVDADMTVENVFGNINDPVNVPEVKQTLVQLFPNPASSTINIVAGEMIREIRLIDMLGQVVYAASPQSQRSTIDVGQLKDGIYLVQVLTVKGMTTRRVQIFE
jgi:hypothetical protein